MISSAFNKFLLYSLFTTLFNGSIYAVIIMDQFQQSTSVFPIYIPQNWVYIILLKGFNFAHDGHSQRDPVIRKNPRYKSIFV